MKKGFERLRHVAVAGSMGLGLLGGGSARATQVTFASTSSKKLSVTQGSAKWSNITNASLSISDSSSSSIKTSKSSITITLSETAFAINDAQFINGFDNAFNAALFMAARSNGTTKFFVNPDTTVDLTNGNLKSDLVSNFVTGIDAQIDYYFYPTRPLVRALYSFTNTTGTDIDIEVLIGGTLGSVGSTTVQASSDDNTTSDAADLWIISNNKTLGNDPGTGDTPVITISRFGNGAATTAANALALGNFAGVFGHRYDFTVIHGSTARILVFTELNKTINEAKNCAKDFETLGNASSAKLLDDFTIQQLNEIVNYDAIATSTSTASNCVYFVTTTSTTTPNSGGSSGDTNIPSPNNNNGGTNNPPTNTTEDLSTGTLDLASITTLLGLLGLARIRKKNHPED